MEGTPYRETAQPNTRAPWNARRAAALTLMALNAVALLALAVRVALSSEGRWDPILAMGWAIYSAPFAMALIGLRRGWRWLLAPSAVMWGFLSIVAFLLLFGVLFPGAYGMPAARGPLGQIVLRAAALATCAGSTALTVYAIGAGRRGRRF